MAEMILDFSSHKKHTLVSPHTENTLQRARLEVAEVYSVWDFTVGIEPVRNLEYTRTNHGFCSKELREEIISQGKDSGERKERCGRPSKSRFDEMTNQKRCRKYYHESNSLKDSLYQTQKGFIKAMTGSTASSSSTQNVAFVSKNTSSTNDVSTAYSVSNPSGQNSQIEEMDLKWQVAMISMRMKKFYKKTGRKLQFDAKEPVGFDKTKVECYNCHKTGHFARECRTKGNQDSRRRDAWNSGNKDGRRSGKQEDSKALVTIDGEGVDWTSHSEEEEDYALMACNSSGSDTEVTSCSNKCKESYAKLKKLYDAQREQLSDASIEIKAYTQGLKKVEAQLVAHQQGQLWYEEKIRFMKIDLDDKTDVLTYHKKLLAEAQKEKEDLKAKVEKWHNSSKNLGKLLNTQMSANDKFGLGYGDHRYDGILSYENEVLQSVFMNKESELEKQPLYDRFVTAGGMHVVPPPMTGNYMPSGPDIEYESDSEDEYASIPTKEQEAPSFANQQVKTPRETVKNQFTHSKNPKVNKKELGYGFTARACFVYGSLNHLIRDCDFHEKRMAKKAELNNAVLTRTGKIPVNTARASGTKNVSTARHNFNRQAVLTSTAKKVNTVKPIVNRVRPANFFHKTHSPSSRPFNKTIVLRTNFSKQKVNTAKVNAVSAVGGKRETAVKPSAGCNWRPQRYNWHNVSKYNDYPLSSKNKGIVDSGCSRHMTGNKAYLAEFQDFNGGPVDFGGSKGYITGKEFKNKDVIECCGLKGIKRDTTMLELYNKMELLRERTGPLLRLLGPCLQIHFYLTLFRLKHFGGKSDEGFLVGYSQQNKAFRVYNLETKRVEENLHITFLENKPNVARKGPTWLFDLDYLTDSMNYHPVRSENQGDSKKEDKSNQDCFVLPIWPSYSSTTPASKTDDKREDPREEEQVFMDELERLKRQEKEAIEEAKNLRKKFETLIIQEGAAKISSTNIFSTVSTPAKASSTNLEIYQDSTDGIFTTSSFDDEGAVADFTNLEIVVNVSPIPTSRIHSSHPSALILGDPTSAVQTRSKVNKSSRAHAFLSYVQKQRRNNHKDFQHCLFACFLSQNEPKKIQSTER
ncbi:ribonuclease H-like domain-containing protein [Tanacetum coccineum]